MQTRFATAEDHVALASLYAMVQDSHASAYPHMFKHNHLTREGLEELIASGLQFLVAEQNGRIVGYVLIQVLDQPDDFEHHAHKALLIHNMAMNGGSNTADVLLNAAYDYGRAQGISDVQLEVWAFNSGVERWVKSMGYRPLRTRYTMNLK